MKIAFIGMTHLGLVSAVGAASKGFEVIGFDPRKEEIEKLSQGDLPVSEPELPELLAKHRSFLSFTSDPTQLSSCSLIYLSPDISTDEKGVSDLNAIQTLFTTSLPYLGTTALIIVLSQVPPGFTRTLPWPKEQLFYQVETLIFGQAVHRTLFPERFIIGLADPKAPLPPLLSHYLEAYQCPLFPMRYESAELTKIAINLFLVSSLTTTNTLADLSEKIGASWGEIVPALKLDRRIGPYAYLVPGLGIAGGNLERDLVTFSSLANQTGANDSLIRTWQMHSQYASDWALRTFHQCILPLCPAPKIALLGLAYKKDTASIKNSPALRLLASLSPFSVATYDPKVTSLSSAKTAKEALKNADVVIAMTPWDEFKTLKIADQALVIDPFAILSPGDPSCYFTLGTSL